MVMGAETAVAEDVATEQPVAESTEPQAEAEKEAEPTLEELKAALAAEKTAREQAETKAKNAYGQLKGKLDTEAELKAIRREQAATKAYLQALAKGQISGDVAVTEKELAEAQANLQRQEVQEGFNSQASELLQGIQEDAEDAGLVLDTASEFAEVRQLWNDGLRAQDLRMMRQAERAAREVRRNSQVAAWEQDQAAERKKNGSLTTPNIRASGNKGSAAIQELVNRSGRGEPMTTAEMVAVREAMAKGIYPKRQTT